jgi:hypothetical protein
MRLDALLRRMAILVVALIGAFCVRGSIAWADDSPTLSTPSTPKAEETPSAVKLDDNTTKHVSFEMATYKDTDNITVFTPSIGLGIDNVTTGASLRGRYLVDVVSAASVDIVSTASRRWTEGRQAGTLTAEYKPHDFGASISGAVSSEPDYLSYGFSAGITKDLDEKNTTLAFGYGYGHDTIGRSRTPFAEFSRTVERGSFNGGITQIINRTTVGSLALDVVIENGDQSKPYRYIPMFSADVAGMVPKGASIAWVTANRLPERPLEQLPLERHRFALSGKIAHRLSGSTVRLDERVYTDSWGLNASTTDARWIFDVGRRVALWPHVRFHAQTPVTFWQRAYVSGAGWDLPEYRTGDRELGPLWTTTGGGGVKVYLGSKGDPESLSVSLTGDASYTSFLNDLYLTSRTSFLGAFTLEYDR